MLKSGFQDCFTIHHFKLVQVIAPAHATKDKGGVLSDRHRVSEEISRRKGFAGVGLIRGESSPKPPMSPVVYKLQLVQTFRNVTSAAEISSSKQKNLVPHRYQAPLISPCRHIACREQFSPMIGCCVEYKEIGGERGIVARSIVPLKFSSINYNQVPK
jgi:hypothetical protein